MFVLYEQSNIIFLFFVIYITKILKLEPENCCSEKLLLVADYVSPLLMHFHTFTFHTDTGSTKRPFLGCKTKHHTSLLGICIRYR